MKPVVGVVTSNKMQKTVMVMMTRLVKDPKYGKYVKKNTKLMAHDEHEACNEGDRVQLETTRPLSKRKRWNVVDILRKAEV